MANSLLTPEELSALAEAVQDGAIPVDTGYNTSVRVKKHDLASEDSTLGVNVGSLDMINERFIRQFRLGLLEVLRSSPRVNPKRVQIVRFADYLAELKPPLSVNVIRMNPLRGFSIVVMDPVVVFSSLVSFFGGMGPGVGTLAPTRLFTPTETRIINLILGVFFRSLKDAWAPVMPLDFELVSSEINPQFAQIADENDLVILTRFDTEVGPNNEGFIDLVYPYSSLKPIRELLRNRVQSGDGNEDSDKQWRDELTEAVNSAPLEARVLLATLETNLSAVEDFQEGDILYFKKPDLARMLINDVPSFEVQIGAMGKQVAVQIEESIIPGHH